MTATHGMEMYRSGHNGAHSKCVSPPGLMGSNPIISARTGEVTPIGVTSPVFLLENVGFGPARGPGGKEASGGSFGARATAVRRSRTRSQAARNTK